MEQISPYGLTTLQRVKDILFDPSLTIVLAGCSLTLDSTTVTGVSVPQNKVLRIGQQISGTYIPSGTTIAQIVSSTQITLSQAAIATETGQTLTVIDQPTAFDTVLTRLINYASDYITRECGRLTFVQQTIVNDTYSAKSPRQDTIRLRNYPVFPAADGIHIASFQWRAGTPSNPNWTDFIPDQYELINPHTDPISGLIWYPSGMIRVYGVLPRLYNNMIRASYTGGYPVNWANAEDHNTHWLPGDITNVCENLVVRRFKRRQLGGMQSQALEGATHTWSKTLDQEDLDIIGHYRDINF